MLAGIKLLGRNYRRLRLFSYSDWSTSATIHSACTSGFVTGVEAMSSPILLSIWGKTC